MTARFRHRAGIAAASLAGLMLGVAFMLALMWQFAHADPDPVVASDHALRTVATVAPADAPDPPPSVLDRALDIAGPVGRLALAGIAAVIAARLLAWQRAKRRWLRRGWVGNAAGACYAALVAFGGVLALGGSVASGLVAVGGVTLYGLGLASDPETARAPSKEPPHTGELPSPDPDLCDGSCGSTGGPHYHGGPVSSGEAPT